jgi:hypothetical protein
MELEGSLSGSQDPATDSYPGSGDSSSDPHIYFFKTHFNIILPPYA